MWRGNISLRITQLGRRRPRSQGRRIQLFHSSSIYSCTGPRNEVGIQMLPDHIWERVFKSNSSRTLDKGAPDKVTGHLRKHDLFGKPTDSLPNVHFDLPELKGRDIEEHFVKIGRHYTEPYSKIVSSLIRSSKTPPLPKEFAFVEGWVRYSVDGSSFEAVPWPDGDAIVFDVETVVSEGGLPVMAAAFSGTHWYSWCSDSLVAGRAVRVDRVTPEVLIPLGPAVHERIVIGHHVGFDRSFVREEYERKCSKRRFLDTLSMHVCVSGMTTEQRMLLLKDGEEEAYPKQKWKGKITNSSRPAFKYSWKDVTANNGLADVYKFYCGTELAKSKRKAFEKGTSDDVRADFQDLMRYCVLDVKATRDVLVQLWPLFTSRSSHPVSLFGMMEMLTAYIPVNDNWNRYLSQADEVYRNFKAEIELILNTMVEKACHMAENEAWRSDPWLWDLNWETKKSKKKADVDPESTETVNRPSLNSYPKWYRDLCRVSRKEVRGGRPSRETDFSQLNISTRARCVPKLMRLLWNGYPLHYQDRLGWGYLVPDEKGEDGKSKPEIVESGPAAKFPLDVYRRLIARTAAHRAGQADDEGVGDIDISEDKSDSIEDATPKMLDEFKPSRRYLVLESLNNDSKDHDNYGDSESKRTNKYSNESAVKSSPPSRKCKTWENAQDIGVRGVRFCKLPHKNGPKYNVGNPLSKDFISQFDDNVLTSYGHDNIADTLLQLNKKCTYWTNARDRLREQLVVWIGENEGVILPRLMPAGTVSRRAVEKTWLTASNVKTDRIGSELKTMIMAPKGTHFVGADVDSQELWIASLLGDRAFAGIHGCTAFGWMTLQGKKADGTDMHSRTAAAAGCSRDHAKVLNYARIYGAGEKFAASLLRQFNPSLSAKEAATAAKNMFLSTKGRRIRKDSDTLNGPHFLWEGGTESSMFNELETIARSEKTSTPVLGARISRALESRAVGDSFMTSRINWVVQSSAVDYLHLMLISMRDLTDRFGINSRLVISIHDEVRFLVPSEDRYRASLLLHTTNLLVRALFAKKVGMEDLPFSVAFFSAVDVDKVIRKNVRDDSMTPSNPHGLKDGYGIDFGEELDVYKTVEMTGGGQLGKERVKTVKASNRKHLTIIKLNTSRKSVAVPKCELRQSSKTSDKVSGLIHAELLAVSSP